MALREDAARSTGASSVALTGIGTACAAGVGLQAFRTALLAGAVPRTPPEALQGTAFEGRPGLGVPGFDPKAILGAKGLRYLNRATLLACSAARLAFEDAGIELDEATRAETGVALGTAYANFHAECAFTSLEADRGHRFLDPLAFPNTVVSTPAGHAALMMGLRRFNTTVSTGETAGLDALIVAVRHLRQGRARVAVAGGAEELSPEVYARASALGCAAEHDGPAASAPFDRRRKGPLPAEAGAFVVLEDADRAGERGARVYAQVKGFANGFDAERCRLYLRGEDPFRAGPATSVRVLRAALSDAGIAPAEVDAFWAAASGSPSADLVEAAAVGAVFGSRTPPVTALKGLLGETLGAAGGLQAAAAALACREGFLPPTAGYGEADPLCGLDSVVAREALKGPVGTAVVHCFDPAGLDSAVVLVAGAESGEGDGRTRWKS